MMQLDLNSLNLWQQQVFAAALLQRMLPNYAYFSQATQFGEFNLLNNQLDIIWQKLSQMPIKFNSEIQLEKLQQNIPADIDFDIFAVYPAIDVCSGLVSLFESFDEKETRCAFDLSLLSLNTVSSYLTFISAQGEDSKPPIQSEVESDPLFVWELETQQELFDMVSRFKPSKQNCQAVKALVMQQRLSSLAIEY